jgi:hypothetical protein
MNSEMGFLCEARASDSACLRMIRGELAIEAFSRRKLHMRVVGVKRALHCLTESCSRHLVGLPASPLVLLPIHIDCLPM